jgi:serine/threonine-protein kinase RsbW
LSGKVSEPPTVILYAALSPCPALLSSIIWGEFCSIALLAGRLLHLVAWKDKDALEGLEQSVSNPPNLRIESVRTRESDSCLEIEALMPSDVKSISPLLDRVIRLIEESRCVAGEELAVELALREALNNAVVHGNQLDPGKLVQVYCRCELGKELSLVVRDQGIGFDPNRIPDPLALENLRAEHGRGILLMRTQMDEVSFERGGTEVHMHKSASIGAMKHNVNKSDSQTSGDVSGPGNSDNSKR